MNGLPAVSAICAAGAAFAIGLTSADKMPQLALGEDALSVAFGGAKNAISDSMFHKADSYFHGGVDMDCSCHHHHHEHDDLDEDHDGHGHHDHDGHGHHDHDDDDDGHKSGDSSFVDPWAWINEHVRAPEVERHLEGEKAVELMPLFWASVKSNPHNIEAWTTALYIADRVIGNAKLAAEILADAKKENPLSMELALAEGRFLYHGGKGDVVAAEEAFRQARLLGLRSAGGDVRRLSPHDSEQFLVVLDYLSSLAAKRGDAAALAGFLEEAKSADSGSIVVKSIMRRISALESAGGIR